MKSSGEENGRTAEEDAEAESDEVRQDAFPIREQYIYFGAAPHVEVCASSPRFELRPSV